MVDSKDNDAKRQQRDAKNMRLALILAAVAIMIYIGYILWRMAEHA